MAILILLFAGIEAIQWQHDVVLDWDPIPGAESYGLIRSRYVDGHWQDATTIRTEGPEYRDPDLPPGRYRWEAISAWNLGGQQWDWNAAAVLDVQPVPIKLRWEIIMAAKNFSEPADIAGWLDTGEFLASRQVEVDGSGDLAVTGANTSGWRASNGWDPELGALVDSSEVSWSATGDAGGEVAVSETDPTSLEFDGIDDIINIGAGAINSVLHGTTAMTVAAWVKPHTLSNRDTILYSEISGSNLGIAFDIGNTGGISIRNRSQGSDSLQTLIAAGSLNIDEWQLVLGEVDFTGKTQKLYVNNVEVASASSLGFGSNTYVGDTTFNFDSLGNTFALGRPYDGFLSDVVVYDRILSSAERQDLYDMDVPTNGLVAYWKLTEGTGITATDSAGTNDGTITGSSWADGESPLYQPATNGQPIPGISQGDDLTGKKIYGRQVLNDNNATMQSFSLQVTEAESAAISQPYRDTVATLTGLRQHLSLQDGSTTWTDTSGNGHHGTLVGASFQAGGPTEDVDNVHVAGDGVDDRVDATTLGNAGSLLNGGVWAAYWLRTADSSIQYAAGVFNDGVTMGLELNLGRDETGSASAGKIGVRVRNNDGETISAVADVGSSVHDDEWHLVVITVDPSIYEGARIWFDSVDQTLTYNTGQSGPIADDWATFQYELVWFCRNNRETFEGFFDGDLAEPAIGAGAVLQQSDVDALWAAKSAAAVELESVGELETDSYSSINSAITAGSAAEFETDSYSSINSAMTADSVGELETDSYSNISSVMTAGSAAEFETDSQASLIVASDHNSVGELETDSYSNISPAMTADSVGEFETDNLATMDAISQLELISITELSVDSLSVITASSLLQSISEFQTDSRLLDAPPPLPQFFIQRHVREADIRHVTRRVVRLDECEKQ